jgi:peroxiredoxin
VRLPVGWPLLLLAALWLGAGCATVKPEGEVWPLETVVPLEDGKAEVGRPYFDFTAPELMGGTVRLSSFVGKKVVLLQFWGIRCAPCLAEMEFLVDLQARYRGRGLQVIGVNTDRASPAQLTEALAARKIESAYPQVLDPNLTIARHYTQWLIPVSVLIDRSGVVRAIHTGYKPELAAAIEAEVEALLGR